MVSPQSDHMCTRANDLAASEPMPLARELDALRAECERLRQEREADHAERAVMAAELDMLRRDREAIAQRLDPSQWWPPKAVAYELNISCQTVRDRIRAGHVLAQRVGGRVVVNVTSARQHHRLLHGHREPSR